MDVNVRSYTTYYYTIRSVVAEASFDSATMTLTPEILGPPSAPIQVRTQTIRGPEDENAGPAVTRHFILMRMNDPMMNNDGTPQEIDPGRGTTPINFQGRTMAPIRAIIEAMGGTVDWYAGDERITLELNSNTLFMWLNQTSLVVNSVTEEMDVAPNITNDRTMLPLRFAAEHLGCEIEWIGTTQQIIIVYYRH